MASKIIFTNIKYTTVKSVSDISKTDKKYGIITSRNTTKEYNSGDSIDILALNSLPALICGDSLEFSESNIIERRTLTEFSGLALRKGRLPVNTDFYKCLSKNDTIIIILHSDCHQ